jgi:predicted dehydrogenase/nucleoside-diphosphate-sugar epimerase
LESILVSSEARQLPRIAIIGCGAAAREFFLPALQQRPGFRTNVVVIDRCREQAERVAREFAIERFSSDVGEVASDVDAAIIATPHRSHAEQSLYFLERGKHVLVEKPIGMNSVEVDAMINAADKHRAMLVVNNYRRLFPAYQRVRQMAHEQPLGAIRKVTVQDGTKFAWQSVSEFYLRDPLTRGVLLDRGAHTIDILGWWLRDALQVESIEMDTIDGIEGLVDLELSCRGIPVQVKFSRFQRLENCYTIECEHGTIRGRLFDFARFQLERSGHIETVHAGKAHPHYVYAWQLTHSFVDAVQTGATPAVLASDVAPSIRVIEQAYKQARLMSLPWYVNEPNIDWLKSSRKCTATERRGSGFTPNRVLVTGAGGFVGGWVVESFLSANIGVRAGIRSWNSALRLARHPTEIVRCDVLKPQEIDAAIEGCDAVVHCAVGNEEVSTRGTENVMRAAEQRGVRRVVHLSSVAVYGKPEGTILETQSRQSRGNHYAHCKIRAEEVCESFMARGVPIVMLRPSVIYGPFSEAWTVSFGKRLVSGRWGTFGRHGEGICNLVYVTDVVQAVYRALTVGGIEGETYNVNGNELITWNEYFVRMNEALGRNPLRPLQIQRMIWRARVLSPMRNVARFALNRFGPAISKLRAKSSLAAKYMSSTESSLKLTPTLEQLRLFRGRAEYVIDKAKRELGYEPSVRVAQGLAYSAEWLRRHGVLYVK